MWSLAVSIPSNIAAFYHWVAVKILFCLHWWSQCSILQQTLGLSCIFPQGDTWFEHTYFFNVVKIFYTCTWLQAGKVLLNWPWLFICLPDEIINLLLSICGLKLLSLECWTQKNMQPCALLISSSTQFFSLASLKAFSQVNMTSFTTI